MSQSVCTLSDSLPLVGDSSLSLDGGSHVHYIRLMSESQIPDGISLEALKALADKAEQEPEAPVEKGDGPFDGMTKGQLIDTAEEIITAAMNKCADPMIHKMMAVMILSKMVEWHTQVGTERITEDERSGVSWLRDAGKLQAAWSLISDVGLGPADFLCSYNDD